ncbi:MAG: alpha/beta hydrolase-fold protein [Clostridia bacterium]|nr:alpha/beta hydrolase-fold protein [Clostridia bacterium]
MDIDRIGKDVLEKGSPIVHADGVLFVYSGKADSVYLVGDYNSWERDDPMKKAPEKDLWYLKKDFPDNSRFDYKFVVDGNWITDPNNKNMTPGGSGYNSTLIMPQYHSNYERIIHSDVPRGTVAYNQDYFSNHLQETMKYHVYLPFGYDKTAARHILYALDGSDYLNFASANLVFDYLIAQGEIPKAVVVLVDPHERTKEYTLYEPYYDYVITELLPFVESRYISGENGVDRTLMGVSWGGLTAIYLAANSNLFCRVLSQSGSFWPKEWLIFDILQEREIAHIRFCLQTGTIADTEEMNDVMYKVLKARGSIVDYMKYAESHSWGNWKGHMDEGLRKVFEGQNTHEN